MMQFEVTVRADSAEDYRNAIKALMDGAGLVGFDIPDLPEPPAPEPPKFPYRTPSIEERKRATQAKQQAPVEAPVPSAEELPIEAPKPAQKPAAPDPNRVTGDWTPGGGKQAEDAPAVTIEDVQAVARKLALAGHMDKVKAVLDKYGAEKITKLPAESWAAAKAEMEAASNE